MHKLEGIESKPRTVFNVVQCGVLSRSLEPVSSPSCAHLPSFSASRTFPSFFGVGVVFSLHESAHIPPKHAFNRCWDSLTGPWMRVGCRCYVVDLDPGCQRILVSAQFSSCLPQSHPGAACQTFLTPVFSCLPACLPAGLPVCGSVLGRYPLVPTWSSLMRTIEAASSSRMNVVQLTLTRETASWLARQDQRDDQTQPATTPAGAGGRGGAWSVWRVLRTYVRIFARTS